MRLNEQQIQELKDKYLNKHIIVPYTDDMWTGYGIKGGVISGVCTFIGYNSFLPSWGLQVTINRLPIRNVDYTKIKLK